MDDHVILIIGDNKFYLSVEEAFDIARTLNGSTRIKSEWVKGSSKPVFSKPEVGVASITPMPGPLQMELEANTRERDEK
jgi:hypothetical protein